MYAYLFRTQSEKVFKFGTTNESNPMKRISVYYGLNKPTDILCIALCNERFEAEFKEEIDRDADFWRPPKYGLEWVELLDDQKTAVAGTYLKKLFYDTLL